MYAVVLRRLGIANTTLGSKTERKYADVMYGMTRLRPCLCATVGMYSLKTTPQSTINFKGHGDVFAYIIRGVRS